MNFGVPATDNVCGAQASTVGGASGGGGTSGGASIAASGMAIGGGGGDATRSNPKPQAATSDSADSPSVRTAGTYQKLDRESPTTFTKSAPVTSESSQWWAQRRATRRW